MKHLGQNVNGETLLALIGVRDETSGGNMRGLTLVAKCDGSNAKNEMLEVKHRGRNASGEISGAES